MTDENGIRASLERIEDKMELRLDRLDKGLHDHQIADEKRFGRIDKMLLVIAVAVAAPKLGAPSVGDLTAHVLTVVGA